MDHLGQNGATLYLTVQARTSGWVALGVGSQKMDGAYMVLAYAAGNAPTINE